MTHTLQEALEFAVAQYQQGSRLMLLFDYDGTLTQFVDHPQNACLPAPTRVVLGMLSTQPRVSVGIISGRELDDLKRMVGLPGLYYAGSSGLECELRGEVLTHPLLRHTFAIVAQVSRAVEHYLSAFPGAWVERKQFGLTVHYRRLDAERIPCLHDRLAQVLTRWGDRLHVVTGTLAVEIFPNLGWTKGTAVDFFLERIGSKPCQLIYAGDEATDLEVLWEVGLHNGITIGVGRPSATTAQYELYDADAVEHVLEDLCGALGSGAALEATKSH